MDWLGRWKNLIAIAIAGIAVILSLVTVLVQRRQQRQHAFQQIHDVLMTPEHQRGRCEWWGGGHALARSSSTVAVEPSGTPPKGGSPGGLRGEAQATQAQRRTPRPGREPGIER